MNYSSLGYLNLNRQSSFENTVLWNVVVVVVKVTESEKGLIPVFRNLI